MRKSQGFTLMEMLIVIAIIAILIAIAIPLFTSQLEAAKRAADEANARSGYASVTAQIMLERDLAATSYVFDPATGSAVQSGSGSMPSGYGQWGQEADYEVGGVPVHGVAEGSYVTYTVSGGQITGISWGSAHGALYSSAASRFVNLGTALTADTSAERMQADVDAITAIAESYLGMTKEEFLAATGTAGYQQGRLTNNEGVGIITYRYLGGNSTNVRGNTEVLKGLGFNATVGPTQSNSFSNSDGRVFFSDYFNSGAEGQVKLGKVEYDSDGKINKIQAWVVQQGGGTVPDEFQNITVTK